MGTLVVGDVPTGAARLMMQSNRSEQRSPSLRKARKQITLTPEGRTLIQAYADANNTSFSAAIEMLALAGMETDTVKSVIPFVMNQLWRAVNSSFNRMAKLTASAAVEAGAAHDLTAIYLLHHLNSLRYAYPDEYETVLQLDEDDPDAAKIRVLQGEIKQIARTRSARRLKKSLAELDEIMQYRGEPEPNE